jgi:hypothetical protein
MNDFTKEELSLLWRSLNHMIDIKYFIQPTTKELLDKIQSLIDSYCDHNWYYTQKNLQQCAKCGWHK